MNVETVKIIIAIKEIEQEAARIEMEANQMLNKAEGMVLAAKKMREEFDADISIYEDKMKKK